MSTVQLKNRLPQRYLVTSTSNSEVEGLRWFEKVLLGVGILEIPLQIDKYFMFHERDANLGAVGGINVSVTTLCLIALYLLWTCLLYTSPSPRDRQKSRMPSSA